MERTDTDVTEIHDVLTELKEVLNKRISEKFYGGRALFGLRKLSPRDQQKFNRMADEVYKRALQYLDKWYDFTNNFHLIASKFNLKKCFPSTDDCLKISEFFDIDLSKKTDQLFSDVCIAEKVFFSS